MINGLAQSIGKRAESHDKSLGSVYRQTKIVYSITPGYRGYTESVNYNLSISTVHGLPIYRS